MPEADFDDPAFLARLRAGDAEAYRVLVRRFHGSLVGVASGVIGSRAQAEEVVQDAWLAVYGGIGGFQGRSSLATWLFSIVLNRARTRASREGRLVALPHVLDGARGQERAVDPSAFAADGHWRELPRLWDELDPERVVAGRQLWAHVQDIVALLPAGQKAVVILRDMEGGTAEETCALLAITPENQRVLLHRARLRLRRAIDELIGGTAAAAITGPEPDRPAPRPPGRRRTSATGLRFGAVLPWLRIIRGLPAAAPARDGRNGVGAMRVARRAAATMAATGSGQFASRSDAMRVA